MAAPKIRNTEKVKVHLNYFQGGPTFVSPKLGIANSFYSSTAMDHRTVPDQISTLPGPSDISGGVVTDLIGAVDQDLNGVRYGVGDKGNVYRISTSNVVSKIAQLTTPGAAGMYYDSITDQVYIPSQNSVSLYGQVTTGAAGSPTWRPDQFGKSASSDPGCTLLYDSGTGFFDGSSRNNAQVVGAGVGITSTSQISATNATGTYAVPTTLAEVASTYCAFVPDIEPGFSIAVNVTTVGSGNYTLTLHDSLNTPLASVTTPNANMVVGYNEFVFGSQVRMIVQQAQTGGSATYHFHLTSSASGGFVATVPANANGAQYGTGDMESVDFLWFAYRLVATANTWHPTSYFNGLLCIGNGKYLSTYDFSQDSGPTNTQFSRHALIFKNGYEVCGLSTNNQYLVIALERRSTNSNRNAQDGQLVFWDQTTQSPNFIIDIPMGSPYGLQTFNSVTYFICAGSLFAWSGGQTVIKVRKLAYQNTDYLGVTDSTIVNPNTMAIRYNLLAMGYPSSTTNVKLNYGVYTWGAIEITYPNSLGYSYQLSNGQVNTSTTTNLQIGSVYNFIDQMYTSWRYTDASSVTHYGLDLLSNSSTPAPSGNMRSLIYDSGMSYKKKQGLRMQITFLALPTGYTLQAFYNVDRGSDILSPAATAGSTKIVFELDNARGREFQWGFIWTQVGATAPLIVTGVTMELASLEEETDMTPYPD
jgi:hypothetical protein